MTTLKVPDMHCEKCVERIKNALSGENFEFTIVLSDKTVSLNTDDESEIEIVREKLDDLGFSAEKV